MARGPLKLIAGFANWLAHRLHWWDLYRNRIDQTRLHQRGLLEGYSSLALWLPIPVIVILAYGLPNYALPYWRGWPLLVATALAILTHLLICRFSPRRSLPLWQWGLLMTTGAAVLVYTRWATPEIRQADAAPYAHLYAVLAAVVLTVAMPISHWLAERLVGKQRDEFRQSFAASLQETQLYVRHQPPPPTWRRVRRSFFLAAVDSLILLALIPAIVVLLLPRLNSWWVIGALLIWWLTLAAATYDERLKTFQVLLRQALLVGWPLVLSLVVIILSAARVAGVDYVTTILDQPSTSGVLVGTLLVAYFLFWLHNYWEQRALAEVLLGFLWTDSEVNPPIIPYRQGRLQIHGGGRLIAIREVPETEHKVEFQSYLPLEVFEQIVDQLEGRARAGTAEWKDADRAANRLGRLQQAVRAYYSWLLLPASALVILAGLSIYHQQQEPGLVVTEPASTELFDLGAVVAARSPDEPLLAVAASGGGTRAALYSYSLIRGLKEQDALDQVVLISGVSGGSLGTAYFAAHRNDLLAQGTDGRAWRDFREVVTRAYIKDVLAGSGEWRFATGTRLGHLLSESFSRALFGGAGLPDECVASGGDPVRTLGGVGGPNHDLGVIFNSAVVGSWHGGRSSAKCVEEKSGGLGGWLHNGEMRQCATVADGGSRLAITNLAAMTPDSLDTRGPQLDGKAAAGWPLDFDYAVLRDSSVCLAQAASLSANFPPVFSNAAIQVNGAQPSRYWVTDGGSVENRGVVSLLLGLRAEVRALAQGAETTLPPIRLLVGEASGFARKYGEDRGVGAKFGAASRIANKLIAELALEVDSLYRAAGGRGVRVVYLPMPEVLRVSGAFGTHWAMPSTVEVRDPATWYLEPKTWWRRGGAKTLELDTEELKAVADYLFSDRVTRRRAGLDEDFWEWVGMGKDNPREMLKAALTSSP